jgi:hypothetical protein
MNLMRDLVYGPSERSTYHTTMVNRVKSHLKRLYGSAGKEHGFIPGRRIDAWGYDKDTKTLFFCEIKVSPSDLNKAVTQIHSSAFNYHPKDPQNKVLPVIAIPKKLAIDLHKYKPLDWNSFKSLCQTNKIAIWIIEQSDIKQIQGPKPKMVKSPRKKTTNITAKKKTTKKLKPKTKRKSSTKVKSKTSSKKKASAVRARKTASRKTSSKRKTARNG